MEKIPKNNFEIKEDNIATKEELQEWLNSVTLDIPKHKRDLDVLGNLDWLNRNIFIRNHVPEKYNKALRMLYKESKK